MVPAFKLSSRDLVQMMAERGILLAHTTILRCVQGYVAPLRRWVPTTEHRHELIEGSLADLKARRLRRATATPRQVRIQKLDDLSGLDAFRSTSSGKAHADPPFSRPTDAQETPSLASARVYSRFYFAIHWTPSGDQLFLRQRGLR
jgi:hypothetical protein